MAVYMGVWKLEHDATCLLLLFLNSLKVNWKLTLFFSAGLASRFSGSFCVCPLTLEVQAHIAIPASLGAGNSNSGPCA